jgi:hypothetical protein
VARPSSRLLKTLAGTRRSWQEPSSRAVETALELVALPGREEFEPPTPLSIAELREARAARLGRGDRRRSRRQRRRRPRATDSSVEKSNSSSTS